MTGAEPLASIRLSDTCNVIVDDTSRYSESRDGKQSPAHNDCFVEAQFTSSTATSSQVASALLVG
jgi:hypothetical protein